jgi:TonB family protein
VPIDSLARRVAGLRPRLRHCYAAGLSSDPSIAGKLTIVATVTPEGEVARAEVSSSTGVSPGVGACAAAAVRRLELEPPKQAGRIVVPLTFRLAR